MKDLVDALPMVRASSLVVSGHAGRHSKTALIRFTDDGVEYEIGVRVRSFPSGGFWVLFVCPRCSGNAQGLRLLGDAPVCGKCVRASGMRYRIEMVSHASKRAALTAPRRAELLRSGRSLLRNPHPGRKLERRASIELRLRRSLIVAEEHGLVEHKQMLEGLKDGRLSGCDQGQSGS